ncbi:MAG TPA: acyl-CoA dehydrogenase family protein [Candidatus Binataceae bacterium]|nr:acyl-CoA dehydrogenase family protein [Candidatus Binataceae bacterium]
MDLNFSVEDEDFRRKFRAWLDANLPENERIEPLDLLFEESEDSWERRLNWHRKLHSGGWVGISWPKEYGGRDATLLQQVIYEQELQRAYAPALISVGTLMVGPTLVRWGTEEQKRRYIPKILSGDEIWCQGYSEPNSGSDLGSLQTRAVEEGDYFIVNGAKVWTSDARHADMCILLVRTDTAAAKHKGISYLLVDMHSPGVTVRPLVQMTGASGFNQVFFEDVKVPKANLVGEKNRGWEVAITTLMFERSGIGLHRDYVDSARDLARLARMVVRDGRPAWDDASVRQRIAQFACEAAAIKYVAMRQLTRLLRGGQPGSDNSITKLVASELLVRMHSYAYELLGPYAQILHDTPHAIDRGKWSYRMLSSRSLTIGGGTSEIQRNILGDRVLGLPRG